MKINGNFQYSNGNNHKETECFIKLSFFNSYICENNYFEVIFYIYKNQLFPCEILKYQSFDFTFFSDL